MRLSLKIRSPQLKLLPLCWIRLNITNCHPRLSGIRQRNRFNSKKDSGQAGMTEFEYLLAGLIIRRLLLLFALEQQAQTFNMFLFCYFA
jgi:hypothetical protein